MDPKGIVPSPTHLRPGYEGHTTFGVINDDDMHLGWFLNETHTQGASSVVIFRNNLSEHLDYIFRLSTL